MNSARLVVVALLQLPIFAQRIELLNGNIYLRSRGENRQITAMGIDSDAHLSPDLKKVVFLRQIDAGDSKTTAILMVDLGTMKQVTLLTGPVSIGGGTYVEIVGPQLAPDNKHVYFLLSDYGATTGAVIALDLSTKNPQLITYGLQCIVVPNGKYVGDLIIQQRRQKLGVGFYYWFYLFTPTPDGKEVGVVGQDENDVKSFLDMAGDIHGNPIR